MFNVTKKYNSFVQLDCLCRIKDPAPCSALYKKQIYLQIHKFQMQHAIEIWFAPLN